MFDKDPQVIEGREYVLNGNVDSWVIYDYDINVKDRLVIREKGSGGLVSVSNALQDDKVEYIYVKLSALDPDNATRVKYAFITWQGPSSPHLLRATASNSHRPQLSKLFLHHADIFATAKDDVEESAVRSKIKKAGGADYDAGGKHEVGHESYESQEGVAGTEKASFAKTKPPGAGARKLIRKKDSSTDQTDP